jgi:type IV secretion system protein VirB1
MLLSLAQVLMLAAHCAPASEPVTLAAIARVESGFDDLAIGVNGPRPISLHPKDQGEAGLAAGSLIAHGANIDLGLAQINSKNLRWLGLSPSALFDPCTNLAAAAAVLSAGARLARRPGEAALDASLSYYNTGHPSRGLANGYVAKVRAAALQIAPPRDGKEPAASPTETRGGRPGWDVFGQPGRPVEGFVITPATAAAVGDHS